MTSTVPKGTSLDIFENLYLLSINPLYDSDNRYAISKMFGTSKNDPQPIPYFVAYAENIGECSCCTFLRPMTFKIHVLKHEDGNLIPEPNPLIVLDRPLNCSGFFCFCCLQKMDVQSPPGSIIGRVEQLCSLVENLLVVKDADNQALVKMTGPLFICQTTFYFNITSLDENNEMNGAIDYVDNSGIEKVLLEYPYNSINKSKALQLGAAFLIYILFGSGNPHTSFSLPDFEKKSVHKKLVSFPRKHLGVKPAELQH